LLPRITEAYRNEHFDIEIMREMGERNFLGCSIKIRNLPPASSVAYGLINRQIEAVDSGYRSALSVQTLAIYAVNEFGSEEIKKKYL